MVVQVDRTISILYKTPIKHFAVHLQQVKYDDSLLGQIHVFVEQSYKSNYGWISLNCGFVATRNK